MSKLATFLVKDSTKDGYAMAIAGICPFIFSNEMRDEILGIIRNYTFSKTEDIFRIDYFMAQYFCRNAPDYILAWGMTIHVPSAPGPTGGIIGNPHRAIESADGMSQDIGNGLSVGAYPGGPGVIILGEPLAAEAVLKCAKPSESGYMPLLSMAHKALDLNISTAIMVTDGTGRDVSGCALTIQNNKIHYISIDGSAPDEN